MEENKGEDKTASPASSFTLVGRSFNKATYIESIKREIFEGNVNPLEAMIALKRMSAVTEEVLKDDRVKELGLIELERYLTSKQKSIQLYEATICKAATYTFYDFSECNHPELDALNDIIKACEQRKKLLEEELKLLIPQETGQIGLGIASDSKEVIIPSLPVIEWKPSGEVATVKAPKKIQKIGMKFMKI